MFFTSILSRSHDPRYHITVPFFALFCLILSIWLDYRGSANYRFGRTYALQDTRLLSVQHKYSSMTFLSSFSTLHSNSVFTSKSSILLSKHFSSFSSFSALPYNKKKIPLSNNKNNKDEKALGARPPLSGSTTALRASNLFQSSEIVPVQLTTSVYHHIIDYNSLCDPDLYGSIRKEAKGNQRHVHVKSQDTKDSKYKTRQRDHNTKISLACALGECERQGKVIVFFPPEETEKDDLTQNEKNQKVLLPSTFIIPYPSSLSTFLNPEQILHLPLYALLFLPALMHKGGIEFSLLKDKSEKNEKKNNGNQRSRGDIDTKNTSSEKDFPGSKYVEKNEKKKSIDKYIVVVIGSSLFAEFVIDFMIGLGVKNIISVSRNEKFVQSKAGISRVIDFSKESFSDEIPEFDLVIDTIADGNKDGSGVNFYHLLSQIRNARYVPLVPKGNQNAQENGIFSQVSKLTSGFFGDNSSSRHGSPPPFSFTPKSSYFLLLLNLIQKIDKVSTTANFQNSIQPFEAENYFHVQDYTDNLFWPKDSETGIRYGFPSYSSSSINSDEEDNGTI